VRYSSSERGGKATLLEPAGPGSEPSPIKHFEARLAMAPTPPNYASNRSDASTTLRDFKKSGAKLYFNVDNEGWRWKNSKCDKQYNTLVAGGNC
jgi:hypothetical protein